ncbi:MAG: divalent-cation tolerance protein CutA [Myxococcota bacterium]
MSVRTEHVVVQVTAGSRSEAERIAAAAVEQRLAASAQVSALRTWYRWKGAVHEADEHRVDLFTRAARFDALAELVKGMHSYELPQVVAVPLRDGTPEFLAWIEDGSTEG